MSSSRIYLMDKYELRSDPCDSRMIRFVNCIMMIACIFDILANFIAALKDAAELLRCIANCVFYSTLGCMAVQIDNEMKIRKGTPGGVGIATPINDENAK